jgi:DNA-binding MarR family transcriptional regulator
MESIKEAFSRVRQDIDFLYSELLNLKKDISHINENLLNLIGNFENLRNEKNASIQQTNRQTDKQTEIPQGNIQSIGNTTLQHINPTLPKENPTHSTDIKALKPEFLGLSIGSGGVPTDRQTDKQTNRQTDNGSYNHKIPKGDSINDALEVLDSLDNLKKEIRLKFKRLTDQEMSVFSLLYQLSEEESYSDYKTLSNRLGLTESSIRDYIGRLIKKGIPVEKTKINNKNIHLSISENLKKITTLSTILQLRDL